MSIYEANLGFFKSNVPQLYGILENESPLCKVEIEESDLNNCILSANAIKCFMHSVYDVENEMKMMFKNIENDVETIILFGIGNGYALEYISRNYKELKSLIVIEPSLEIFKRSVSLYDFQNLFNNSWKHEVNITFITNRNENFISELTIQQGVRGRKLAIANHVYIASVFLDYYENVNLSLSKQLKITLGSFATVNSQWKIWLINSIRNLRQKNITPIEEICKIFKDKTVVIVSAGPSLNKNIDLINKIKDKAIIMAVGTAIKVLDSHGIVPHFRVAIDAYPAEKKVIEDIDTKKTSLMFSNQLYFEILPEYRGNEIRYILDTDFLGKYIYRKSGMDYIEFKNGPSVANGALGLVCELGCKRVIFMGQDLSYTEGGLHAKGITPEAEKLDQDWLSSMEYLVEYDIYGNKVYTIHQYLQMKYVMEKTISRYSKIEFFNATEGGLGIDGAENITAIDLINNKLKYEKELDDNILNLILNDTSIKTKYHTNISNGLKVMKSELNEVIGLQKEIIHFLTKLSKIKNRSLSKVENELDYIEKLRNKMFKIPLYKEVIETELRADLFSLTTAYEYTGNNREKCIESKEKIIIGSTNKISEHIELCIELLEE